MQITEQQKKWAWIIGAVLLVVHFLPSIIGTVRNLISPPVVSAVRAKASPVRAAPAPPAVPIVPRPESPFVKLVGTWAGSSVSERGRCETRLVLKLKDEAPGEYTGYPTRVCGPSMAFMGPHLNIGRAREGLLDQMTQVSSIMSGTVESDALKLKVSQLVVPSPDRCDLSTMTIRPFGNDQIAVAGEEGGTCKGGQMLMGEGEMNAPERTLAPEPFVSAEEAARFLAVPRRFLLSLARKGIRGSYPIGGGDFRKRWIFKKSELAEAINPTRRMPPLSESLDYADRRRSSLK